MRYIIRDDGSRIDLRWALHVFSACSQLSRRRQQCLNLVLLARYVGDREAIDLQHDAQSRKATPLFASVVQCFSKDVK